MAGDDRRRSSTEAVRAAANDDDIVAWLRTNTDPAKYPGLNEMLVNRGIRDDEHRATVPAGLPDPRRPARSPNWFEIFELDDRWMYAPENRGKPGAAQ